MKHHVLVTGGTGCIGASVVQALLEQNHKPVILSRTGDPHRLLQVVGKDRVDEVKSVKGDVGDLELLNQIIHREKITEIIHLAGLQTPECRKNPALGLQVNVGGTLNVFEAARQSRGKVRRVCYSSSAAVMGPRSLYPFQVVTEEEKPEPPSLYGAWKLASEQIAIVYAREHKVQSVGLRPYTVYGVGRDAGMTSMPTAALLAIAAGRDFTINYGGRTDFSYVSDVGEIFALCALRSNPKMAPVYFIPSQTATIGGFLKRARQIAKRLSMPVPRIACGTKQIPISYDLSAASIRTDYGRLPETPLDTGIELTLIRMQELLRANQIDVSVLK